MIRRALSRLVGWLAKGIGEPDSDAMGVPLVDVAPCSVECCNNPRCKAARA